MSFYNKINSYSTGISNSLNADVSNDKIMIISNINSNTTSKSNLIYKESQTRTIPIHEFRSEELYAQYKYYKEFIGGKN